MLAKQEKRIKRHKSLRAKISGNIAAPRFCVFRSNAHIYAQLIDDERGKTILQSSDIKAAEIKKTQSKGVDILKGKTLLAFRVGQDIARKATEKKIQKVVFDRGGNKYHGRVKALADGAREGGLQF